MADRDLSRYWIMASYVLIPYICQPTSCVSHVYLPCLCLLTISVDHHVYWPYLFTCLLAMGYSMPLLTHTTTTPYVTFLSKDHYKSLLHLTCRRRVGLPSECGRRSDNTSLTTPDLVTPRTLLLPITQTEGMRALRIDVIG